MLVRLQLNKNKTAWVITCLERPFYGQQIAETEAFRISSPRFQPYSITGFLQSMHGATVEDFAFESADVVRALGINGVFHPCHHRVLHDERNSGWYDAYSKGTVHKAAFATGMGAEVFYTLESDVALDREVLSESVQAPKGVRQQIREWLGKAKGD